MDKKTVLVTGSSRGIGRACARAFAGAGWHVFINCRQSLEMLREVEKEILASGGTCTPVPGDVSDPDEVRRIFKIIEDTCGGLDVLINNAGIAWFGLLTDMTDEDWRTVTDTNLSSVFYCCRAAVPYMVSRKSGRIINISSMWGTAGASCEAAYSATKGGINALTKALAKELAPSGIQVNAVACGAIDTEMNQWMQSEDLIALTDEIPAGRLGRAEEVADLVYHLGYKNSYLTGQVIGLDGGWI